MYDVWCYFATICRDGELCEGVVEAEENGEEDDGVEVIYLPNRCHEMLTTHHDVFMWYNTSSVTEEGWQVDDGQDEGR